MQSPNPFLVLGIATIAASTIGVSSAEAEATQRRPATAAEESSSVSSASSASTTPRAEVEAPSQADLSQEVPQPRNARQVPRWQQPLQKGRLPKAPAQGTASLDQPQPVQPLELAQPTPERQEEFPQPSAPEALTAASTRQAETSEPASLELAEPENLEPESPGTESPEPEASAPSSSQLRPNKSAKASPRPTSDAIAATPSPAAQPVEAEAATEIPNEPSSSELSNGESPTSQPVSESPADSDPALPSQPVDFGAGEEANTAQTDPSAPEATSPALQDAPVERPQFLNPQPLDPQPSNNRLNSNFWLNSEPSPEYLYPDPNPLSFPTTPEEVEVVGTQPITLQQAVELAIRNNPEFRQAQFRLEQQQARVRQEQAANFPTVGANATFNQQGAEGASRVGDTDALGQPNPNAGDIIVTYQDSTTLGTGISLNYDIYTSGRRPALIEAAQSEARQQQLEIERQLEELILATANDYYDLQSAGAQVNIFTATLDQAEQSLRDAQALERAGVGTRFDVLQAEVEVANTRQELTQQLSQLEIARRALAQRINLSEALDITPADPIEVSGVWELSLEESIVQAYKNRVELEQALIQRETAQQRRRAALAQLGPQVGFEGSFNVTNDFDNDFTFLHSYALGLTVRQSLYDGGSARSQANQQESEISVAEALFEQRREQIRFEVERAYSQLDANFSNIQTTALAVEQAAEALRLARLRFQAGVGTQTDVLRQQTELARAQVNNLQAIIGYNQAITALQRAISNYPEGYLNEVP